MNYHVVPSFNSLKSLMGYGRNLVLFLFIWFYLNYPLPKYLWLAI